VMTFKARIVNRIHLNYGDHVGYAGTYRCSKPGGEWISIIGGGYPPWKQSHLGRSASHPERTFRESASRLQPQAPTTEPLVCGAHITGTRRATVRRLRSAAPGPVRGGVASGGLCGVAPSTILRMVPLPHEGGGDGRGVCGWRPSTILRLRLRMVPLPAERGGDGQCRRSGWGRRPRIACTPPRFGRGLSGARVICLADVPV
jgi:hypothetical protein